MCQGIGEILPPWHPSEIKEARGIESIDVIVCLFTEVLNNCQSVEADEGPLSLRWEGGGWIWSSAVPEWFCQMKADPTILLRTLAFSRKPSLSLSLSQSIQFISFVETRAPYIAKACEAVNLAAAEGARGYFCFRNSVLRQKQLNGRRTGGLSSVAIPSTRQPDWHVASRLIKSRDRNEHGGEARDATWAPQK